MRALFVESNDVLNELYGVGIFVIGWVVVVIVHRMIAAEGQHVADAGRRVSAEYRFDLLGGLLHAGQMRDRIDLTALLQLHHQIVRSLSGGSTSTVGDGNERRLQRCEVIHSLSQSFQCRIASGWEELETERGSISLDDVLDMHRGAL